MRKVTLEVASRGAVNRRFQGALAGKPQGTRISFESPALLIKVLSGRRWDLLQVMTGAGAMTIREASRRMGRDVKGVHADVHTLLRAGLLRKTDDARIVFPYDAIHVDFTLRRRKGDGTAYKTIREEKEKPPAASAAGGRFAWWSWSGWNRRPPECHSQQRSHRS